MRRLTVLLLLYATMITTALAGPDGIDLHHYWDQRCQQCHGHSSEFARRFLRVENQRLAGVHHRENLEVFLRNHYLSDDLIAPISAMLLAQLKTPPLFGNRCSACHDSAAEFARKSLDLRDGAPVGRLSRRPVADYLTAHGGLTPVEIGIVVESLLRVRQEVSVSRP